MYDHDAIADDCVRRAAKLLAVAIDTDALNDEDELRPIIDLATQAVAHRCVAVVKGARRNEKTKEKA